MIECIGSDSGDDFPHSLNRLNHNRARLGKTMWLVEADIGCHGSREIEGIESKLESFESCQWEEADDHPIG